MASSGEAPPIISPVIAPGSDIRPTVFALSTTGERPITTALFTCSYVASRGLAPSANARRSKILAKFICAFMSSWSLFMVTPVTVIAFPTIIPATGIMYLGVKGNTLSNTSTNIVTAVPVRMEAPPTYFPRGTCFARCPAV
ncbi:hypothetical protein CR513_37449, partial [Mucuna pruriens]